MVDKKVLSTKEDLLTAIWESWNFFDKEYFTKLMKPMLERIKAVIKAWGGTTKYWF